MTVTRYVSKRTMWIIFSIIAVLSAASLYFGTIHRFTTLAKYKDYALVGAKVVSLEEYEHEDSDDNIYYRYSAVLTYQIDGTTYTKTTEDIFSTDNVPEEGERIPILCHKGNPNDYVIAKYDWMTHSYLPLDNKGDVWLFTGLLLIGFALLIWGMAIDVDQMQGVLIGSGLLLMGIDGVVMGILCKNFKMFFLLIFGAVGVFILYRYLLVPKERRHKEDAASGSLRLFKVVDIYVDPQTNVKIVVFSLPENNGATNQYYSYDDVRNLYNNGNMYQIDKRVLQSFQETRIVNGRYTININGLDESHIQPLHPAVRKILSRV